MNRTPKKSGRILLRLPHSLHAALAAEAKREGVSLNQLMLAKLATSLARTVRPVRHGFDRGHGDAG